MYENEMIECKDELLNHYLHHFDECEDEMPHFNAELDCLDIMVACSEEIIWNQCFKIVDEFKGMLKQ